MAEIPPALREALELPGPPWQRVLVANCMAVALRWANGNIDRLWDVIIALEQEAANE